VDLIRAGGNWVSVGIYFMLSRIDLIRRMFITVGHDLLQVQGQECSDRASHFVLMYVTALV
jgi:hypothetical protein